MIYGYARVSSKDQNLDRQIEDFLKFGIDYKNIFSDKKSGKDFERKEYCKLIRKVKKGDLIVIKSIDRLGRSYDAIIEEWSRITNSINANILVLDMPILDTRSNENGLIGRFISDIVLQILSFVSENERNNIRIRQSEGIAIAKAKGIKFGRPKKELSEKYCHIAFLYIKREITLKQALNTLNITKNKFFYYLRNYKKEYIKI